MSWLDHAFTRKYLLVHPDGTEAIIVSRFGRILCVHVYDSDHDFMHMTQAEFVFYSKAKKLNAPKEEA